MTLKELKQITIGQFILADKLAFDKTDKKIKDLCKVERAFKRAYKIQIEVLYIDVKHKSKIARKNVKGYRQPLKNQIVVFIDNNVLRNVETLLHELTHEYQERYMNKQYIKSKEALNKNKTKEAYNNSWHEKHARHCAKLLVNSFDFSLDLKNAFDYTIDNAA